MIKSLQVNFCFQETGVLEELGRFERHWQVGRKKLLPVVHFFLRKISGQFFFQKVEVLEELRISVRHCRIHLKKLLPEVGLVLGRLPWRRGKRLNMCRKR